MSNLVIAAHAVMPTGLRRTTRITWNTNAVIHNMNRRCRTLGKAVRNDNSRVIAIDDALVEFSGRSYRPCTECYKPVQGSSRQPRLPWKPLEEAIARNTFVDAVAHSHTGWAAEFAKYTGVHIRTVHRLKAQGEVTLKVAERICDHTGIMPVEIWGDTYYDLANSIAVPANKLRTVSDA